MAALVASIRSEEPASVNQTIYEKYLEHTRNYKA